MIKYDDELLNKQQQHAFLASTKLIDNKIIY